MFQAAAAAARDVAQMASYVIVMQIIACIVNLLGRVQVCTVVKTKARAKGAGAVILADSLTQLVTVSNTQCQSLFERQTSEVGRENETSQKD
jgi:hypothetical protein